MTFEFARWFTEDTKPTGRPRQPLASPPMASAPPWEPPLPRPRTIDWTLERIAGLSSPEVSQLQENAARLEDPAITARCEQVLKDRNARAAAKAPAAPRKALRPVARGTAR